MLSYESPERAKILISDLSTFLRRTPPTFFTDITKQIGVHTQSFHVQRDAVKDGDQCPVQ